MKCTCHIIEGPEEIVHQKCPLCKAAPELLEAAKALEDWWLREGMHQRSGAPVGMFMLRAAIEKAEGRS